MKCADVQARLHGYLDGEFDAATRAELGRHLDACHDCAHAYARQQSLQRMLKENAPDFRPPARLQQRIEAQIREQSQPPSTSPAPVRRPDWWGYAVAACLSLLLSLGVVERHRLFETEDGFKEDAVSIHMRSLQENHLVDVDAANADALAVWFKQRLPFGVPVADLSAQGYTLVGGRLDYLYGQPLAAVVYRRGGYVVNVLVWPVAKSDEFPAGLQREGPLHVQFLTKGGRNHCVMSELPQQDFASFVQRLTSNEAS